MTAIVTHEQDLGQGALTNWTLEACQIGGRRFEGHTELVQVVEVTYQQKSHTTGYIDSVSGFSVNGHGVTSGGGGYVRTFHENVATAIVRDVTGVERQVELPSRIAPRSGSVLRLDRINNVLIGATNVSGKGNLTTLSRGADFFPKMRFQKKFLVLALIGLLALPGGGLTGLLLAAAFCAPLGIWMALSFKKSEYRKAVDDYMDEVWRRPIALPA